MLMMEAAAERIGMLQGHALAPAASRGCGAAGLRGSSTIAHPKSASRANGNKKRRTAPPSMLALPAEMDTPPNSAPSSPLLCEPADAPETPLDTPRFLSALQIVASYLEVHELARLAGTSRRWRDTVLGLPMLWRHVIIPMSLAPRLTDAQLAALLARGGNAPVVLDLRGCARVSNAGLTAIKGCKSLRRLDVRGTRVAPTPSLLHSLSPVVAATDAGATPLTLRRLTALHLAECAEEWHGVVRSPAEWHSLLTRLGGDKIGSAATSATLGHIDFDTEVVLFASQLGSFVGSMWPKPQSRISAAVTSASGDVLAQIKVPAVVENAGWFDAVVVPRGEGPGAIASVRWYFDAAAATGERALHFEPVPSLAVAGASSNAVAAIAGSVEPAAQFDAFLDWASSAGHGRSARHLTNSLAQGRVELDTIAAALPAGVRAALQRELQFRTGCTPRPTAPSRRRPAAASTPDVSPPRSPDLEEEEEAGTAAMAVDETPTAMAALSTPAHVSDRGASTCPPSRTPSCLPSRPPSRPASPVKPGRPGAIAVAHVPQSSPLSRVSSAASALALAPAPAAKTIAARRPATPVRDLSLVGFLPAECLGEEISFESLLAYSGEYLAEVLAAVPPIEHRRSETPILPRSGETSPTMDLDGDASTDTSTAMGPEPVQMTDVPPQQRKARCSLVLGPTRAREVDRYATYKNTELSSVVVVGGCPPCCFDDLR